MPILQSVFVLVIVLLFRGLMGVHCVCALVLVYVQHTVLTKIN